MNALQAPRVSHSNRNGFSQELREAIAEARAAERRLRAALAAAEASAQDQEGIEQAGQREPEGQPYPYRSRPQKMAPAGFQLTKRQLQAGLDEGLLVGQVHREWEKFRDHTFAVARQDWDATWRNWIRTAADRLPRLGREKSRAPVRTIRTPAVQELAADRGEALVSIRGIIDKLTGGKKL